MLKWEVAQTGKLTLPKQQKYTELTVEFILSLIQANEGKEVASGGKIWTNLFSLKILYRVLQACCSLQA